MSVSAEAVLDAALEIGERRGWEAVRLHQVAESLHTDLDTIRCLFREKEDLVEAWFDRADQAMLRAASSDVVAAMPSTARVRTLLLAWLDALEPRRELTRQMILGKLEFGHLHVQIPAVLRISRTVQWLREGAARDAVGLHRGLEETALTGILVSTFIIWLRGDARFRDRADRHLSRSLRLAGRLSRWVPGHSAAQSQHTPRLRAPLKADLPDHQA